jgi:hypothetical protein
MLKVASIQWLSFFPNFKAYFHAENQIISSNVSRSSPKIKSLDRYLLL